MSSSESNITSASTNSRKLTYHTTYANNIAGMTKAADSFKLPDSVRIVAGVLSAQEASILQNATPEHPAAQAIYKRIGATPVRGEAALMVDESLGYQTAALINLDPHDAGVRIEPEGALARSANLPLASRVLEMRAAEDAARMTEAVEPGDTSEVWHRPGDAGSR